jgi:O-antigen ligase
MVTAIVRGVSLFVLVVLVALAYLYFHPILALWLVALAVLTHLRPIVGVAVLFVIVSIDTAKPTVGGIIINYSELEFSTVLFAGLTAIADIRDLNWKPLLWGAPFLTAVAISGFVNISWFKVPFHVVRSSELIAAVFLASNSCRLGKGEVTIRKTIQRETSRLSLIPESKFGWAILAAALFYTLPVDAEFDISLRTNSFFTNANQFAGYLVLLFPFCLAFALLTSHRLRFLWIYSTIWVFVVLMTTLSRAAVLAAVITAATLLLLRYWGSLPEFAARPRRRIWALTSRTRQIILLHIFVLLILVTVLWTFAPLHSRLERSIRDLQRSSSGSIAAAWAESRLPFWQVGWELWKDHIVFGVGPGRYRHIIREYDEIVSEWEGRVRSAPLFRKYLPIHVHNLYLQLAVDFGTLGLLTFLGMLVSVFLALRSRISLSVLGLGGIGLMIAWLIHNTFDVTFPSLALEAGLLLGVSLCDNRFTGLTRDDRRGSN